MKTTRLKKQANNQRNKRIQRKGEKIKMHEPVTTIVDGNFARTNNKPYVITYIGPELLILVEMRKHLM